MQLRAEIQIATLMTAMTNVVIPAIDPDNRLAIEQASLVVGMLSLMAKQLPLQFRFDRDELQRLVGVADEIRNIFEGGSVHETALDQLARSRASAVETLEYCQVEPAGLVEAIRALRTDLGLLITELGENASSPHELEAAETIIMKMSRDQLLRDRALLAPQNWETDPASLPAIETLLVAA